MESRAGPEQHSTDIFNVSIDGGKPANANVTLDVKATINNLNLRAGALGIGVPPGVASLKVNGNLTTSDARLSIFNDDSLPNSMSVSGNFTAGPGTTIDLIENAILDVNGVMTSASGNRINISNEFSIWRKTDSRRRIYFHRQYHHVVRYWTIDSQER